MILNSPPHCGQCSRSIPKARLSRRAVRVFVCRLALRRAWHDRGAQPGIGCEHAVKADQMQARTRPGAA